MTSCFVRLLLPAQEGVCNGLGSWKTFASAIYVTWNGEPSTTCVNIVIIKYAKEGVKRKRKYQHLPHYDMLNTLTSLHLHISSVTKLARHPFLSSYLMGRYFNIVSNYLNLFFYSYSRILPKFSLSWSICFPQNLPEAFLLLLLSIPLPAVDWLPPQLHPMCICLKLPSYNCTYHLTKSVHTQHMLTWPPYTDQPKEYLPFFPERNESPIHSCEPLSHLTPSTSSLLNFLHRSQTFFKLFLIHFAVINKGKRGKRY